MAVSGNGDWPLRSPRANWRPNHRKMVTFGLTNSRSAIIVDLFFGSAGPTAYNEGVSETVTLFESVLAQAGFIATNTQETVSAGESVAAVAGYVVGTNETVPLSEQVGAAADYVVGASETVTLSDMVSAQAAYVANPNETVILTEMVAEELVSQSSAAGPFTFTYKTDRAVKSERAVRSVFQNLSRHPKKTIR